MLRNTIQRRIIKDMVKNMFTHPTADEVHKEIRKQHPSISKATVYRNLHQLADDGEIRLVLIPDSPERFDARVPQHYHFSCRSCGKIFDVDMEYMDSINEKIRGSCDFQIESHDLIFNGLCTECIGTI